MSFTVIEYRRVGIISALIFIYIGFGIYMNMINRSEMIYTHLAYIPILLAGLWWGKQSIVVALLLGCVLIFFHFFGIGVGSVASDVTRLTFFIAASLCIGLLSDRIRSGQQMLADSEERYRTLINNSLTGVFVYRNEKIVFVNKLFSRLLAYGQDELIGKTLWDIFHKDDTEEIRHILEKRNTGQLKDVHYESRLVDKYGGIIWVDILSTITHYAGEQAVLVNVYDITTRKEAEQKRQALAELTRKQEEQLVHSTRLAELGEMAAGIAHELNQPLTGIRNFAMNSFYMLKNNVGSQDDVQENLRMISRQVDRASKIINQMRELTRRTEKEFVLLDINGIIRESLDFLMPQLRLSDITVELKLMDSLPRVSGDRIRLEQVFLNLVTNARQAMAEELERRLSISTEITSDTNSIRIVIDDTGKGFPQEEAEKIFMPFYSTKKAGQGTGLGLSISHSIIKDHNGTIEAISGGNGAIFIIELPVKTAALNGENVAQ